MTRALDVLHFVLKLALGLLVFGLLVPVAMQILSRFTGLIPRYIWTEEIARFCFVWMIMVGAMCAVRDGTHFDLEVLPESANPKVEAAKRLFVHLMIFIVAIILIWYGWRLLLFGWYQTSEIAALPMNWIFVAWPLMGVVTVLFLAEKVQAEIAVLRKAQA
ncbi:TRAP transporter small permease [Marinivivus vitaminiproducens]|uniref:TRAP transporter small permease n=1 Tax=Marinivivus vitaminiproducens TaxID=3035935 RepID=UPI00279A6DD7|nr:TRAP transporter small permease [Geminicoccaceae bacterium SCSIO 64248]